MSEPNPHCAFCDNRYPHYHTETRAPNGDLIEVIVSTFPDRDPRAEVRDAESGEVIFRAVKGPLRLIEGGPPAESGASGSEPPCDEGKETRDEQISRLQHSLALAVEALGPFANVARIDGFAEMDDEKVLRLVYDDLEWGDNTVLCEYFVRAFRRAAIAYSKLSGGG